MKTSDQESGLGPVSHAPGIAPRHCRRARRTIRFAFALRTLVTVVPVLLGAQVGDAAAQSFPTKPIRLVVPWAPGGISDTSARMLAQHMSASMGQAVIVENRPGAGSTLGSELVARSPADGHTLLYADITATAINATAYVKLPYDTLRDFSAVTTVGASPLFLVAHPSIPAKDVRELVALAKAKPGALNYASAGVGSTLHLAAELLRDAASVNIVHVPFKGAGHAMGSLLTGEVALIFSASPPILPHVKRGALRALATTWPTRSHVLPEVPALAEVYPGFQIAIVNGVLGPARLPQDRIERLQAEIGKAAQIPEVQKRFEALGMQVRTGSPAELAAFLKSEVSRFGKVIREAGIRLE
jgi:tripartite-type tricarboxylate transporter receptor subunit TctC